MPLYLKERFYAYREPWQPLIYGWFYLLQNLSNGPLGVLDRTFATWYSSLGHHFAAYEATRTPVPRLISLANGTVLELGPGSGNQLPRFDRSVAFRIYGVEPNRYLFNKLRDETIGKHGLTDVYVPVHGALEDENLLESFGILPGSIDTIVCMQVLCSVPDPEIAAKHIYRLLKPGGQLLFWEHTANRDMVTGWVQRFWNLFWTPLIGGCRLSRDIETAIAKGGEWTVAEVGFDDDQPWCMMPRYWGRFVKQ